KSPASGWGTAQVTRCDDYAGLQAGACFYLLRPYFNNNPAFTVTTGLGTPAPDQTTNRMDWSYEPAFDVGLGWTGASGLGVRGRYFHFDQSSQELATSLSATAAATSAINAPTGLTNLPGGDFGTPGIVLGAGLGQASLTFASDLTVDAYDLEATWVCKCNRF